MLRRAVTRLLAAAFVLLIVGGGGELSVLDGLFFHGQGSTSEPFRSHVEGADGCHAERCTVRVTAQPSRSAPELAPISVVAAEPWAELGLPARLEPPRHRSVRPSTRAPPVSSRF